MGSFGGGDWKVQEDIATLALEIGMRRDVRGDDQVAARPPHGRQIALVAHADLGAVIDSGGNMDSDGLVPRTLGTCEA